jgi:hypothetical protein
MNSIPEESADPLLAALQEEKMKSQEHRAALVTRKLTWVTGLFALGTLRVRGAWPVESQVLLFLVPVVSLVFDLYILGEDYGIKRIGAFVRTEMAASATAAWERWVSDRRDRFSWSALPVSSGIILAGAAALVLRGPENRGVAIPWFLLLAGANAVVFGLARGAHRRLG